MWELWFEERMPIANGYYMPLYLGTFGSYKQAERAILEHGGSLRGYTRRQYLIKPNPDKD